MNHAEALNRILSNTPPTHFSGDSATYELHIDNFPVTIRATWTGFRHNADLEYDYTEFRIDSLKIGA